MPLPVDLSGNQSSKLIIGLAVHLNIRTNSPFINCGMSEVTMRADAARNQAVVLEAADRLFVESGDGTAVSMDDIARAAGVGKGTLFRRFGDRSALLRAVFEARTAPLREAFTMAMETHSSSSTERIVGMIEAIVRMKLDNRQLVRALEDPATAKTGPPLLSTELYQWVHRIFVDVLDGHTSSAVDASWTAHVLLSVVRADLIIYAAEEEGRADDEIISNVTVTVEKILQA